MTLLVARVIQNVSHRVCQTLGCFFMSLFEKKTCHTNICRIINLYIAVSMSVCVLNCNRKFPSTFAVSCCTDEKKVT